MGDVALPNEAGGFWHDDGAPLQRRPINRRRALEGISDEPRYERLRRRLNPDAEPFNPQVPIMETPPVYGTDQPSYWVSKPQYKLLRAHILRGRKKKPTIRKKPFTRRKRPYYRRTPMYRQPGSLQGMGPIVITGRGGYFTDKIRQGASAAYRGLQRALPTGTFERVGRAAGGSMFGAAGAAMGGYAGRGVASLTGMGDYTISKNDLLQLNEGQQVASFGDMNHGVIIMHREYIGDVTQTSTFTLNSFPINPGLPQTFPWLSNIAPNFDQYQILGMVFHFKSTASDFGTTTNMAMGTCILATDYDSADSNYASKIEMENAQYSTSGKPSVDIIHAVECDPAITFAPIKYVRTGGVPSGKDVRLYDQGNFQLATTGMPTTGGAIGELWCTYKIAFYKPNLQLGASVLTSTAGASTWDGSNYWGINPVIDPNNSFALAFAGNSLFLSNLPVGGYIMLNTTYIFGSQLMVAGLILTITGGTVKAQASSTVTTMNQYEYNTVILITSPLITIVASNMTVPASPTGVRTIVTLLDKDVMSSVYP